MENLLSIFLGIGLSAACGFRVFIPLLMVSLSPLSGHMTLYQGFQWIGTYPALAIFSTASIIEIAAYYVPWLDNLLDALAGPAAVVAGTLVAASSFVHMDPLMKWTLAIIAGGGTAALFHGSTALIRGASTLRSSRSIQVFDVNELSGSPRRCAPRADDSINASSIESCPT